MRPAPISRGEVFPCDGFGARLPGKEVPPLQRLPDRIWPAIDSLAINAGWTHDDLARHAGVAVADVAPGTRAPFPEIALLRALLDAFGLEMADLAEIISRPVETMH